MLKVMELNKLVKKTVYADIPVMIEYESTEYCKPFRNIIAEMIKWGEHTVKSAGSRVTNRR